jgi:small subunit ribosomal protein S20
MAHSAQARKRSRQSEKARIRNKSVRNDIKTLTKTLGEKIAAKDAEGAKTLFNQVIARLDKAANAHVYHKNAAARQKSKVARLINSLRS